MTIDDRKLVKTSKFLSLVLRHRPEMLGIELDAAGWVTVDDLLAAANRRGMTLDRQTLEEVVARNDKQRFALSEGGRRIRASQGHCVRIDLGLEPSQPPELLYHGTAERNLESIARAGLIPRGRQHVHLSLDVETATNVGARHGKPAVLIVESGLMWNAGIEFFLSDNGVWLTERVPVEYIRFPEQ